MIYPHKSPQQITTMDDKEEYFEDQIDQIDELSSESLDIQSEPDKPQKPKMTRGETKHAIVTAMKKKQISRRQGEQILWNLGFMSETSNTKKVLTKSDRTKKRKQQKAARKVNRK